MAASGGFLDLAAAFEASYEAGPAHVVEVPGRVNLIGEHIDYCGLPVLPMAISRHVALAFRVRSDGRVRIRNALESFQDVEYALGDLKVDGCRPEQRSRRAGQRWQSYCIAPALELMADRHEDGRPTMLDSGACCGFDGLVASNLPIAAGLSSSSALVNAVGIALAWANGRRTCAAERGDAGSEEERDRLRLAEIMADAERHVGTRGGGMDQAATLNAREGRAIRIDFSPLRVRHLPIPKRWRIVVADSGVVARKGGEAKAAYNRRRSEVEAALARVAEGAAEPFSPGSTKVGYPELVSSLGFGGALERAERSISGRLLRRFRHVATEAARVEAACALLEGWSLGDRSGDDAMREFGELMDASHASLRSDYEVSTPELDELVRLMRSAGCAGARLTGAGFGGCAIGLVSAGREREVLDLLLKRYYRSAGPTPRLFVERPTAGARVVPVRPRSP